MIDLLVALGDLAGERDLVAALGRGSGLRVVRRCVDVTDLLVAVSVGAAPHVLVSSALQGLDRDAVGRLVGAGVACVGVADSEQGAARLAAAGVPRVVVARPDAPQQAAMAIAAAVGEGAVAKAPPGPSVPRAHPSSGGRAAGVNGPGQPTTAAPRGAVVVAVTGPPGAPGRTSVAIALADETARSGRAALLLDVDTHAPSVVPLLALPEGLPGLAGACRAADGGRLDDAVLAGYLRAIPGGPMVLPGLPRADRWAEVRAAALEAVIATARGLADLVVVDVGPVPAAEPDALGDPLAAGPGGHRDQAALAVLDCADAVVVVGAADPLGLLRLGPAIELLATGWPGLPRDVVLTRARRSALGGDPARSVAQVAAPDRGMDPPPLLVPDDRPGYDAAVLAGGTLAEVAPRSSARAVLAAWARDRYRPAVEASCSASISSSRRRPWRSSGSR